MIRETIISAEQEESDKAHDLKLLNILMKCCIEEAIEKGNLFDDNEDDDDDDYYDEDDDDESDDDNDDCACLCDPTDIEAGYCCRRIRQVAQVTTIIPLSYLMEEHPPKKTPESKQNKTFPLKRNEKNSIYINKSGLYGLILHSKLESTHVFRFRVAKNPIVFRLLYKYLYVHIDGKQVKGMMY